MSKHSDPAAEDVLKIVKVEGELGADQVKRVADVHQAIAKLKTKKVKPTAEAVAKLVPEGRRTIRRAARAGAIGW
jgi:hypothetical protein